MQYLNGLLELIKDRFDGRRSFTTSTALMVKDRLY